MKKLCLVLSGLVVLLLVFGAVMAIFSRIQTGEKIGLIRIQGAITDSDGIIKTLDGYVDDPSIKAIVLRINSPGGGVAPSQEIYEEVKKAATKKYVVVSMGSLAASGAYYISAPATRIFADPGTITGSIGVIMEVPDVHGLLNKVGIKAEVIKSGKNKDIASPFRPISPEQRRILQTALDTVHDQFIDAVASGRKIPVERVRALADGRIFTGQQAKALHLVDALGDLPDAIAAAKTMAGIKGRPTIMEKKKGQGILSLIGSKINSNIRIPDIFPFFKMSYIFSP
ncbi:MAG: signal peptide peptidase SppA [Nitrospiraceae bacterium]|nr:signal peptide peptidase SppA [Nitrospiraceae bacterium]